jgi:hypothetical protein
MSQSVFLYKDITKNESQYENCVFYLELPLLRFECGHYFSSIGVQGASFCTSLKYEEINYDNIITPLTRAEFQLLHEINIACRQLGYSIKEGSERYQRGIELRAKAMPIVDRLLSDEAKIIFDYIVGEETEYLTNKYGFDKDEVRELFEYYSMDYMDRGIISQVWASVENMGENEAYSFGYASESNERWFNFELFGKDLLENDNYYELSNGRVVSFYN